MSTQTQCFGWTLFTQLSLKSSRNIYTCLCHLNGRYAGSGGDGRKGRDGVVCVWMISLFSSPSLSFCSLFTSVEHCLFNAVCEPNLLEPSQALSIITRLLCKQISPYPWVSNKCLKGSIFWTKQRLKRQQHHCFMALPHACKVVLSTF